MSLTSTPLLDQLPRRQRSVLLCMYTYFIENDNMPSMEWLALSVGTWAKAAEFNIKRLRQRGALEFSINKSQHRFARTAVGLRYVAELSALVNNQQTKKKDPKCTPKSTATAHPPKWPTPY